MQMQEIEMERIRHLSQGEDKMNIRNEFNVVDERSVNASSDGCNAQMLMAVDNSKSEDAYLRNREI